MSAGERWNLIPTPQYVEPLDTAVDLSGSRPIRIVVGRGAAPQTALAARMLLEGLEALGVRADIAEAREPGAVALRLVEWPHGDRVDIPLNVLDEEVLSPRHHGQSFVIRTLGADGIAVIGAPQGILYGAMTLLQLIGQPGAAQSAAAAPMPPPMRPGVGARPANSGASVPGAYIRDFPHFEHRAASCWLMNGEANRWSYDRGQGLAAYESLVRRKLDFCLRYKINMVVFDGFGFGLAERFPEYPALMQRLNACARERGIRLVFGGYGAGYGMAYQPGPLYEDAAYLGTTYLNRESYPDGPTYRCLGYPRTRAGRDPAVYGTCRANDDLNRLKAAELAAYVRAVEPGALYIHYEDFGGFDTTQKYWLDRCPHCRARWPNDDAAAADGAAGAIARGYAALIDAVNAVQDPETGYDAARDCLVILTSPVYMPSSPSSEAWGKALKLWQNVARALPAATNLMACFRETFPQRHGGTRWADAWNQAMTDAAGAPSPPRGDPQGTGWAEGRGSNPLPPLSLEGRGELRTPLGLWVYFAGGADHWLNDYPFVGTPALNAMFLGAQGLYSAGGDAYQEPQQVLNAEYAWNVRSDGFSLDPRSYEEAERTWKGLVYGETQPAALFEAGGWLERICRRLYGDAAAGPMARHFSECLQVAPAEKPKDDASAAGADEQAQLAAVDRAKRAYLPMAYEKVYGVPVHWRRLALDAKTWTDEITNEVYVRRFKECAITRAELHARLGRQWLLIQRMTWESLKRVKEALAAGLSAETREDLEFLRAHLDVTLPLVEALIAFHEARQRHHTEPTDRTAVAACLDRARRHAEEAAARARAAFPTVSDPSGAEVGALRARIDELRAAIARMLGAS